MEKSVIGWNKAGYEVRRNGIAYAPDGSMIGSPDKAERLCKLGISHFEGTIETIDELISYLTGVVPVVQKGMYEKAWACGLGFSNEKGKWFGWPAHYLLACGFGVGDKMFDDNTDMEELGAHVNKGLSPASFGKKVIENLTEAKKAARNYSQALMSYPTLVEDFDMKNKNWEENWEQPR